jgi:tol-pal system protein YbgF
MGRALYAFCICAASAWICGYATAAGDSSFERLAQAQTPSSTPAPAAPRPPAADARSPGVIELLNQVESLQAELNRLRGQLEVLSNGLDNAQKRQRDMYLDLDTRVRRIEQAGATPRTESGGDSDARVGRANPPAAADTAAAPEPPAGDLDSRIKRLEQQVGAQPSTNQPAQQPPAPAPETAVNRPATGPVPPTRPTPPTAPAGANPTTSSDAAVRRAYDLGLTSYRAGDYQAAIAAFDGIVKRYPRDPLAPNAQYWIGDAWFNLRDFKSAASAQQALINNYPSSAKVPDALLNLGSAYAALGDGNSARRTWEDLIARFPQTDAAEKGKQRLSRLR